MDLRSIVNNCSVVELQRLFDTVYSQAPTNVRAKAKGDGLMAVKAGVDVGCFDSVVQYLNGCPGSIPKFRVGFDLLADVTNQCRIGRRQDIDVRCAL